MLQQFDHFNDFSPALTKKIQERIESFGRHIRYKFNISNPDPHPDNKGQVVWPFSYTLDPATFKITDIDEKREGKQKVKDVGMPYSKKQDGNNRTIYKFNKIKLMSERKGMLNFDMENEGDAAYVAFLELHPKNKNGMFPKDNAYKIFERIDEKQLATEKRTQRSEKFKALKVAEGMSDKEVVQFADAMLWDSTVELDMLRNQIEELAEIDPTFFNDLVAGKNLEYQALIKRAMDKRVIAFDPAEYRFIWASNNQPLAILQQVMNKNEVQSLAEYFIAGGQKADETLKKVQSLIK